MEKKIIKAFIKKLQEINLLEDLKKSLLNFSLIMIYPIHKTLVLVKNQMNYLKDNIFESFLKSIIDFYFSVRVSNFWNNNYIEYESNGDKKKTQSVEEYLNKVSPYLKDIINNLKKSDTWKIIEF